MSDDRKLRQAAEELVERARLGDQNAVGMIVQVRQNAEKGSPRAIAAHRMMLDVAKGKSPRVGSERRNPLAILRDNIRKHRTSNEYAAHIAGIVPETGTSAHDAIAAAQAISRGPSIGPNVLRAVQSTFGAEPEKKAFAFGVKAAPLRVLDTCKKCPNPAGKKALHVGFTMGLARRLQAARRGNIAALSPKAAWELT